MQSKSAFDEQGEMAASTHALVRQSLHETLVAPLRQMILEGELRPGDKVPEEELCVRFGVSRTPIREALKVLAAEGVLQILPHRGAIVARITHAQIDELFPIMAALERLAGALACARASDQQIARVRALHDEMMGFYRAGNESAYLRLNWLIHEALFDLAGNDTLACFFQQILTRIHVCRFIMRKSSAHWQRAVAEHERIIEALEARDGHRLADLLDAHVMETTAAIARDFIARDAADPNPIDAKAGSKPRKPTHKGRIDERSA
ncbi:GntR family transcriptional regulator [Methylovirgula sp. HY1]|uniref:GntR family transcriptional regulator n=1 Tax=Methylovirgula sp. HY1 TaxID=2822761 RepID=UPI002101DE68|nr:GntR family transcriptional regulator [Methylovirgula sp. HY1]